VSHPLVERLGDPDPAARREACAAIARDPAAALLVEPLGAALADPDPGVRRAAGNALARLGRSSDDVDAVLHAALRGEDRAGRFEAARALAALAPPGPKLLPALLEALESPVGDVAWEAARILVDAGRLHAEVAPIMAGLARAGGSPAARRMAVFCLGKLAPEQPATGETLLEASRDADVALRRAAVSALPGLLEPGPEVAARLEEASAEDPDPGVRRLAERGRSLMREAGP